MTLFSNEVAQPILAWLAIQAHAAIFNHLPVDYFNTCEIFFDKIIRCMTIRNKIIQHIYSSADTFIIIKVRTLITDILKQSQTKDLSFYNNTLSSNDLINRLKTWKEQHQPIIQNCSYRTELSRLIQRIIDHDTPDLTLLTVNAWQNEFCQQNNEWKQALRRFKNNQQPDALLKLIQVTDTLCHFLLQLPDQKVLHDFITTFQTCLPALKGINNGRLQAMQQTCVSQAMANDYCDAQFINLCLEYHAILSKGSIQDDALLRFHEYFKNTVTNMPVKQQKLLALQSYITKNSREHYIQAIEMVIMFKNLNIQELSLLTYKDTTSFLRKETILDPMRLEMHRLRMVRFVYPKIANFLMLLQNGGQDFSIMSLFWNSSIASSLNHFSGHVLTLTDHPYGSNNIINVFIKDFKEKMHPLVK
jgi:hypothetical protein